MENAITWKTENSIGHLVFTAPPSNTMTPFFFQSSEKSSMQK
ncbi:MAG TPA: hypothetical protein PK926_17640 [Spirochaetota bacterium]|nr:hypothetical protein [Spirochaetota bacterium]HPI90938.1 hypothetical protein [Spirochaetota bacterium]HPR47069.1 hypothetical protein [Spirochaetota bacterium]